MASWSVGFPNPTASWNPNKEWPPEAQIPGSDLMKPGRRKSCYWSLQGEIRDSTGTSYLFDDTRSRKWVTTHSRRSLEEICPIYKNMKLNMTFLWSRECEVYLYLGMKRKKLCCRIFATTIFAKTLLRNFSETIFAKTIAHIRKCWSKFNENKFCTKYPLTWYECTPHVVARFILYFLFVCTFS